MDAGDGAVVQGLVVLAFAAAPVIAGRLLRRRLHLRALRTVGVDRPPTDPEIASHPSRPRTFTLRIGAVEGSGVWRPRGVELLLGRPAAVLGVDVVVLAALAALALTAEEPPAAWYLLLAGAAVLPLVSAALALRALGERPAVPDAGPTRWDLAAAWAGWLVLAATFLVGWLVLVLVGLGLVLGSGG